MVESGKFYSTILDPILAPMRQRVAEKIKTGEKVIDIACGTGAQLAKLSGIASSLTGIDLSESMIEYATKQNIPKSAFFVNDASDLSIFKNKRFDSAIMSLALHQFDPDLVQKILNEIRRISNRLILVDYAVPLPQNYVGFGSRIAEFMAGREHNRNFKKFYNAGGLNKILPQNGY